MNTIKNNDYSIDNEQLARFAKAMGHPARITILQFLASMDSCYFGDIHNELPIAKATVSQHLKELKDAGLIQGGIGRKHKFFSKYSSVIKKRKPIAVPLTSVSWRINSKGELCKSVIIILTYKEFGLINTNHSYTLLRFYGYNYKQTILTTLTLRQLTEWG